MTKFKLEQEVKVKTIMYCNGKEEENLQSAIIKGIEEGKYLVEMKGFDSIGLCETLSNHWVNASDVVKN